ncbi:protein prenyltransferase alpha subunit repeat-containing protein 1 [Epargyreus clarus]|uniref:protein prenyltransferase alpha subunit repeat-containing protein 1 n=1 Tax=Epargyreus clarus TaxID=520877 RepID=UPI003C30199E
MDEDKSALVEKIIKDVHNVLAKIDELSSFEIIPVDTNYQNKSPVLHLENCLGLESWCVKHVYMFCYSELMNKYCAKQNSKTKKVSGVDADRFCRLLNVILLLNPELSTFWNRRRALVQNCVLEKSTELHFTRLVLSRKPKCNDAFSYRRWLLDAVLQDDTLSSNYLENLINEELSICELASDKCPNNYHSWNQRMWFINKLQAVEKQFDIHMFYIKEYIFSERWIAKHVSDFSCFHYRQFCMKNILKLNNKSWKRFEKMIEVRLRENFAREVAKNSPTYLNNSVVEMKLLLYSEENVIKNLLSLSTKKCNCVVNCVYLCRKLEVLYHELALNNELIKFYKYHETLWYHRRFIIHEIIMIIYDYFGLTRCNGALVKMHCKVCSLDNTWEKQAKMVRYDCDDIYSCTLFEVILSHERKFIQERRNDFDIYADRHERYLKFSEGLSGVM